MAFWRIGCRWSNSGGPETAIYDIFFREGIVFVGEGWPSILKVQPDDIFSLTSGADIIAVGKVKSSAKTLTDLGYTINGASKFSSCINKNFSINDIGLNSKSVISVELYNVKSKNQKYPNQRSRAVCRDRNNWKKVLEIYKSAIKEKQMENYIKLLKNTKNLILTGAPGTGKTYLAKQIASYIVSNGNLCDFREMKSNDIYKDCIKVVQFHPSYDYADFIEGLRPVKNGEQISFERQDGVLKSFCKLALNDFDHAYERFYVDLMGGKLKNVEFHSASEGSPFHIEVSNEKNKSIRVDKQGGGIYLTKENIIKYERDGQSDSNERSIATYAPDIIKHIKDHYNFFVLIIDEINRGEVSKIFGELFNAIDIGYRGKGDPIDTQFQNMLREEEKGKEDKDPFYDGFYVPENVYIIGTMNDIDRSVESMDFAFRRRFAWVEIKASDRQEMLKELPANIAKEAKLRMDSLNNAIWKKDADDSEKIEGMSSAYHIGASYFLNLKNYIDIGEDPFEALWEYHLEPLLGEYLRGIDDSDSIIDRLHKSYKNPVASNDSQEDDSKSQT